MQIETKALVQALRTTAIVLEKRNTIPILSSVLLDSSDKTLKLRGTNLDQQMTMEVPTLNGSRVRACFNQPEALAKVLLAGGGDTLTIEQGDGKAELKCGQMQGTIATLPAEDHPLIALSDVNAFDVELGEDALAILFRVAGAMSTEETRYYLNGVYFHHVEAWTWRFAATDGHRLYVANVELPNAFVREGVSMKNQSGGIIIPSHAIRMLRRLAPHIGKEAPIRFRLTNTFNVNAPTDLAPDAPRTGRAPTIAVINALVHGYPLELAAKLIDGTFPDYARVLPDYGDDVPSVLFKRADLARALDGIMSGMSEKSRAVKLTFDPSGAHSLVVSARWIDTGFDGKIAIPATVRRSKASAPFEIGYNGGYLRALIDACAGEELSISTADSASPGSIVDPSATNFRAVLMPMRI